MPAGINNTLAVELGENDPEIAGLIEDECNRQRMTLNMIASENIVSKAVLAAQGSILTNKYAEGYPGLRYYGGCEYVDRIEKLAIQRARVLFEAEHVNVQPHSGSSANLAVFLAFLKPGDKILGMNLGHGGHLTHGSRVNISGRYYHAHYYGVDQKTGLINYEEIREMALKVKPRLIIAGASSYPRMIDFSRFKMIADECKSLLLADIAHIAGLIVAGLHPNPVGWADFVTSTTHKTLRGPRGGLILCKAQHAVQIDRAVFPGTQGGPLMHIVAAKAVAFKEAESPAFCAYQKTITTNARTLGEELKNYNFEIVTGGTDTHLLLLDLRNMRISGAEAEAVLGSVDLIVNKNLIPFESQNAKLTSGIRIGTAALTSRGMNHEQMGEIALFIYEAIKNKNDQEKLFAIKGKVNDMCHEFPLNQVN